MKYAVRLFLLAAALYFTIVNPPIFSIRALRCDLMIVLLCIYTLYFESEFVYLSFFAAGLTIDASGGGILGLHSLFYMLTIFAVERVKKYIYRENVNFQIIIILLSSFIYRVFDTAFYFRQNSSAGAVLVNIILSPLYTAFIFAVVRILMSEASRMRRKNEASKQSV